MVWLVRLGLKDHGQVETVELSAAIGITVSGYLLLLCQRWRDECSMLGCYECCRSFNTQRTVSRAISSSSSVGMT